MAELRVAPLFELRVEVGEAQLAGTTPAGTRRIVPVTGGSFEGPELRGQVLPGGSDWIVIRPDGVIQQDVRIILRTDDGALVLMTYRGIRHGPPEVMERLDRGEPVEAYEYYFRSAPAFETASADHAWLNRTVAVAVGERVPGAALYSVYRVL